MVTFQSSSFIDYIYTDLLRGWVNVHMKDGGFYTYSNVSRRAIANLRLNPNMSLGMWFNDNCDKCARVTGRFAGYLSNKLRTV